MRKIIEETKQHLVDIMKGDEELGLYELGQRVQPFVQLEESKEERDIRLAKEKAEKRNNKIDQLLGE